MSDALTVETVLFIDDHPAWTAILEGRVIIALMRLGRTASAIRCTDLASGLNVAGKSPISIVFLDLTLRDSVGLATLRAVRTALPHARIFVVSGASQPARMQAVLRSGADAFIPKDLAEADLDLALHEALAHGFYAPAAMIAPARLISSAELRVLQAAAEGKRDRQISTELHMSVNTVETHMKKLFREFDVANRVQLVTVARQEGYVD
jgi:two-component system nitrate/nitrite response regulator NarP